MPSGSWKLLGKEHEGLELQDRIRSQIKERFVGQQREAFLCEELKAIQEELGERDSEVREFGQMQERFAKLDLPEEAKREVERALKRLQALPAAAAETAVVRTGWTCSLRSPGAS